MAKWYGSKLCRGPCGRLFALRSPRGLLCDSCAQLAESAATAGPAMTSPVVTMPASARPEPAQAPPKAPRPRPAPPARSARRDWQPSADTGTLPMLRALAAAPDGLTTPRLAELAGSGSSWTNALGTVRQLMLKQEARGRVEQAGTAPGDRTRPVTLWRITSEGRRYVREAGAAPAAEAAPPQPDAPAPVPVLAGHAEIRLTGDDLARLDSGQIKAVFAGVGSVLAARQEAARARRAPNRTPGMREAGEYWIICCARCRHPGGVHIVGRGCRFCAECPEYIDGDYGRWSDAWKPSAERTGLRVPCGVGWPE